MLSYTELQIQEIAENIIGHPITLRPIGNHQLKRHLVYHLTNAESLSVVFKLYYKKNRWNREIGVLKWLDKSKIKSPKLIDYGVLEDNTDWLMIEYIDGEPFEHMKNQIRFTEQIKLVTQMGEELGKIHSLKTFDYFGRINEYGNVINEGSEYALRFMESRGQLLEELINRNYPETSLFSEAGKLLRQNFHLVEDIKKFHLCVNDYGPRNVLVKKDIEHWNLCAVIDFEQCSVGNKECDLATLYYDLRTEHVEFGEAFLAGYREFSDISDDFFAKVHFYMLDSCLGSCTWAREQAPAYYQEMIDVLNSLIV